VLTLNAVVLALAMLLSVLVVASAVSVSVDAPGKATGKATATQSKPKTVKPKIEGRARGRWLNVVTVPKGDPRARPSAAAASSAPAPAAALLKAGAPSATNCMAKFNAAHFASVAAGLQSQWYRAGVRYESDSRRQFGSAPPVRVADCTSFGQSVLEAAGYGCLFGRAKANTRAMDPIMRARGGYHQVPKTGDIVMWSGHFGIVVQACPGGKVSMVAMGLSGCRVTGCITVASLKSWGSGQWYGFWTPRG